MAVAFMTASLIIVTPFGPKNRSPEDVAIVFALPILFADTILPYVGVWLASFLIPAGKKKQRQRLLPLYDYSGRIRVRALFITALFFVAAAIILLTGALYAASFIYGALQIGWAVFPARHLARTLFVIGVMPASFGAGLLSARRLTSSHEAIALSLELTSRSLKHFIGHRRAA